MRSYSHIFAALLACFLCCHSAAGVAFPPACATFYTELQATHIQACKSFVSLLEDQSFCSFDQTEHCCTVLDAAIATRCHCWAGFPTATVTLFGLLYQHCSQNTTSATQENPEGSLALKVFFGVLTGSANFEQRQAVRSTWAQNAQGHRVVFFSATPHNETAFDLLRREAANYEDLVVLPHTWESYFNITHQTLEMCRMAAVDPSVTHLVKVDDDSYVHMARLLIKVKKMPREKLFLGYMEKAGGKPHRDPQNRWHVPLAEWPWETYPAWAHGAGYVITKDLVNEIAAGAAMKIQNHTLFRLEDISMGAWVEFVSKDRGWFVQRIKDKRFNFNGCFGSDLVSHYIQAEQMRCMYDNDGQCCIDGKVVSTQLPRKIGPLH